MVKFNNVSQYYGNFQALYNISFNIPQGCLLALLGPNGAGKSTTMSIMTGFRPPIKGEVLINEIDIFEYPEKAKSYIGYLPEIPPLYPELTVKEFLTFVGELREIDNIQGRIKEILYLLKLEERENALIKNLSKGLKQRVGIAQSIIHKPKVLVLDEPTVGLEPSQLIEFRHLIRHLAQEENMTVIISTHIMVEAAELCDRVIIINEGKKIFEGSKEDLLQNKNNYIYYLVVSNLNDKIIDHLKTIKEIINIEPYQEGLKITTNQDISENIVSEVVKLGVGVKSISPLLNSLEQMFLELTTKAKELL